MTCILEKKRKSIIKKAIRGYIKARYKLITAEMNRNQERYKLTEFIKTSVQENASLKKSELFFDTLTDFERYELLFSGETIFCLGISSRVLN